LIDLSASGGKALLRGFFRKSGFFSEFPRFALHHKSKILTQQIIIAHDRLILMKFNNDSQHVSLLLRPQLAQSSRGKNKEESLHETSVWINEKGQ
jgi:hypothetical protein